MTNVSRLQQIGEDREVAPPPSPAIQQQAVATNLLLMALKALSQRAVAAIASLTTLVYVASAWYLLWTMLPDPKPMELGGLALYGVLIYVMRRH